MSKSRPPSSRRQSQNKQSNVGKQNSDQIYLIQNENQVLKLKNYQLDSKISQMKKQLGQHNQRVMRYEREVQILREGIKNAARTEDLILETHKRSFQDKLDLVIGNVQIMTRKIADARQASILEEQKIPNINSDIVLFERDLWKVRIQKEGTKISLENIQKQVEKLRKQNDQLISKRKYFQPKQREISEQIQQRIRLVKNNNKKCSQLRKQQVSKFLNFLVLRIQKRVFKESLIMVERYSLIKKYLKKKIFILALIRKKYINSIKVKGLQAFRKNFRPLEQIQKATRIIQFTRNRRIKNQMFRIWRSQSAKAEFALIRKFQVQNCLERLSKSIFNSNLYCAFNCIKFYGKNIYHQEGCRKIVGIINYNFLRAYNAFFSSLIKANNHYNTLEQIDKTAKQQSQLLIKSMYFGGLAKVVRDNKIVNRTIKFRYFRQLKKLIVLARRRQLGQMLTLTNQKLMQTDLLSICFSTINKQTVQGLINISKQQNNALKDKNTKAYQQLSSFVDNKNTVYKQLSILKVSQYLKGLMGQSFNHWRSWNRKCSKLSLSLNILHSKILNDINFGFALIQIKRFQKLKLSISEKIKSCQFSYNYLVQENAHIKTVLDKKNLQLQKSKFVGILQKIVRNQKQIKSKYFFKFLKSGLKCWKFKKIYQRVDIIMSIRLKCVFMFLLKEIQKEKKYEQRIQYQINNKVNKVSKKYLLKGFQGFKKQVMKNKKIKRVLSGIFDRNLQLDSYNFYNKLKKITVDYYQSLENENFMEKNNQKKEVEKKIIEVVETIQTLNQRLKYKQKSLVNRKVLALRLFFIKNIKQYVGYYINKWIDKVKHEKNVLQFASILDRKTRIIIHKKFILGLQRKDNSHQVSELQSKADRFKQQLEKDSIEYEKFIVQSQKKSKQMKQTNQNHTIQTQKLSIVTDHMDEVKILTFKKNWNKKILFFVMKQWKKNIIKTKKIINKLFTVIYFNSTKIAFQEICQNVKQQGLKHRIKTNLSRIYNKNYRHNVGLMFNIWRVISWNKKVSTNKQQYKQLISSMQKIEKIYNYRYNRHYNDVDFRINDRKKRKIFDFIKKYSRIKITIKKKKNILQKWIKNGYQSQFVRLVKKITGKKIMVKQKIYKFKQNQIKNRAQLWFNTLAQIVRRKKIITKLFINRFIPSLIFRLNTQFISRVKNYHRYIVVAKKDRRTFCIQKVIQTFEKKRKDILCINLRKWRKNLFLANIQYQLFRRLTKKSFYNRLQGCFYAWKRQKEAKNVIIYHQQEGEVRRRKVEIIRLQRFLQDFKKQKGLLLQNQEGNYIVSPRFQQQKEKQLKKDKNLRYKFISRIILSMNGYNPAVKAWNNLQMYAKLRQRCKKAALFVLNSLRRPQVNYAFRIWHKATKNFAQMFETMNRKNLIKILTRQKDKMQMYYSNKLVLEQEIKQQVTKYKILSHQDQKREKLCVLLFNRHARNCKLHALLLWKKRVEDLKDFQLTKLQQRGQQKIEQTQYEIKDLFDYQAQSKRQNMSLQQTVKQALEIAEMVQRITEDRDKLSRQILEMQLTCQNLLQQNEALNSKLYLAQKQAMNLLLLSSQKL